MFEENFRTAEMTRRHNGQYLAGIPWQQVRSLDASRFRLEQPGSSF